jgi:endonuclease/exonuclease/phosphatase family metal-dependent hydrolase
MLLAFVFWVFSWQASALPPAQAQPAAPAQERPASPLTVLSFNIRYGTANDGENHWLKRREQLFALLREQQADVVGLQEALHGQLEEIVAAVPGYAYVGVGRADGRQAGEYAAILYRTARLTPRRSDTFWFSDTPGVVKSMSWGNRIERVCTWAYFEDREGPAFYLYNVHLDHESQPSREKSAALLMSVVNARDPKAPVIVTGDFNSGEDNPAAQLVARTLRDTFRAAHPDAKDVGTFTGFAFGKTAGDKIDYVFAEPGVEVLAAGILRNATDGRYPSDHFPVMARIRLR